MGLNVSTVQYSLRIDCEHSDHETISIRKWSFEIKIWIEKFNKPLMVLIGLFSPEAKTFVKTGYIYWAMANFLFTCPISFIFVSK